MVNRKGIIGELMKIYECCNIIRYWEHQKYLPPLRAAQLKEWQGRWSVLFSAFLRHIEYE